ncbi:hypothetical protein VaNZ11_009817, partial [Volvox africanus]
RLRRHEATQGMHYGYKHDIVDLVASSRPERGGLWSSMRALGILAAVLLVLVMPGRTTPLDVCLQSVVSTLSNACNSQYTTGNGSVSVPGKLTEDFLNLIGRCTVDTKQDITLLAPNMSFTDYMDSINTTAAVLWNAVDSGIDAQHKSLNITRLPMPFWGRTLALIGGVPPTYLGLDIGTNSSLEYDSWVVDPIAIADLYDSRQTMDLSALIMEMPYRQQLGWFGIHQLFRGSVVVGQGTVASIPLGGLVYQMFYRRDVLEAHGLPVPVTWDDFVATAAEVNGTDMNGDGKPDYGVCLQRPRYCFNGFSLTAIWSSFIQSHGTQHGAFFDPETMEPLVNNAAMALAMVIFKRLRAYGPPDETSAPCLPYNQRFVNGECALTLSWGYQLKANLFRPDSRVRDNVGVALLPGSTMVLNRTTGQMMNCTSLTVCPFAEELFVLQTRTKRLVNRAPYLAVPTASVSISAKANVWHQTKLLDFFTYLASRNVSWELVTSPLTELGPYRYEHFDPAYINEWVRRGYPKPIIGEFLDVMKRQLDSSNVMVEVRTLQAYAYRRLLDLYATKISNDEMGLTEAQEQLAAELQIVYGTQNPRFKTIRLLYRYSIGLDDSVSVTDQSETQLAPPAPSAGRSASSSRTLYYVLGVPLVTAGVLVLALIVYVVFQRRRRIISEPTGHPGLGDDTTLVVSDVEGSTVLWEAIEPGVMDVVFNLHHDCMRRTAVRCGGYESQTEGDSFIIAFHSADDAVRFALAVQQALLEEPWPRELLAHEKCRPVWLARTGVEVPLDLPLEHAAMHRSSGVPHTCDSSRHGAQQAGTQGSFAVSGGLTKAAEFPPPAAAALPAVIGAGAGGGEAGRARVGPVQDSAEMRKQAGDGLNLWQMLPERWGSQWRRRRRVHSTGGGSIAVSVTAATTTSPGLLTGSRDPDTPAAESASGVFGDNVPTGPAGLLLPTGSVAASVPLPPTPLALSIDTVGEAFQALWREVPAHIADPAFGGGAVAARWPGVKAVFRPPMSKPPTVTGHLPVSTLATSVLAAAGSRGYAPATGTAAATGPCSLSSPPPPFNRSRSLPVNPLSASTFKRSDVVSQLAKTTGNITGECGSGGDADVLQDTNFSTGNTYGGILDDNRARQIISDADRGSLELLAAKPSAQDIEQPKCNSTGSAAPSLTLTPAMGVGFADSSSISMGHRLPLPSPNAAVAGSGLARSASAGTGHRSTSGVDLATDVPQPPLALSEMGTPTAAVSLHQQLATRWGVAQRMLRLQSHSHPYLGSSVQGTVCPSPGDDSSQQPEPALAPSPPSCTLVRRGLSVRIGMHTGIRHISDLVYSDVAKRWKYSGEVLAAAKAVSDAANGGDVLIGTATLDRLDPDLLTKRCRLLYIGRHVLRGGNAATVATPATLTQQPPPPGPGAVADLYALYSPRLLPRVGLYRPPRTELSLGLSVMDAPLGRIAYGLLVCHGLSNMAASGHDADVVSEARSALMAISDDQLLVCHGVPAAQPQAMGSSFGGTVVGVFRNPYHAILWALQAQEDLLHFPWSPELLAHEQFEAIVVPAAAANVLIGSGPPPPLSEQLSAHLTPAHRHGTGPGLGTSYVDGDPGIYAGFGQGMQGPGVMGAAGSCSGLAAGATGYGSDDPICGGDAATGPAMRLSATLHTPNSASWASRTPTPRSNMLLASYDGIPVAGAGTSAAAGGGWVGSWKGSSASGRVRPSVPGPSSLPLQRQAITSATVATASMAMPGPAGGTVSAPIDMLISGASPVVADDSACEVSTTDGEPDSLIPARSASGCVQLPSSRPRLTPMEGVAVDTPTLSMHFPAPSVMELAVEASAISAEVAQRSQNVPLIPEDNVGAILEGPMAASVVAAAAGGESGGDMVLYRGPRIKGAISYGSLKAVLDPLTGRVRYEGKAASCAAKMVSYASIGMVVASVDAVEAGHAEDSDGEGHHGTGCGITIPREGCCPPGDIGGAGVASHDIDRRNMAPPMSRIGSFREDPEGPSAAMAAAAAAAAAALLNLVPGGDGNCAVLHRSGSISTDTGADLLAQMAATLAPGGGSGNHNPGDRQQASRTQGRRALYNKMTEDPETDGRSSHSGQLLCGGGGGGGGNTGEWRFPSGCSTPFSGCSYTYSQNPLYGISLKPESRAASRTARTMSNLNPDSRQASRTLMQQPCAPYAACLGPIASLDGGTIRRPSRGPHLLAPLVQGDTYPASTASTTATATTPGVGGSASGSGGLLPPPSEHNHGVVGYSPPRITGMWLTSASAKAIARSARGEEGTRRDADEIQGTLELHHSAGTRLGSQDPAQPACGDGGGGDVAVLQGNSLQVGMTVAEDPGGVANEGPQPVRAQPLQSGSTAAAHEGWRLGRSPVPQLPSQHTALGLPPQSPSYEAPAKTSLQPLQSIQALWHLEKQDMDDEDEDMGAATEGNAAVEEEEGEEEEVQVTHAEVKEDDVALALPLPLQMAASPPQPSSGMSSLSAIRGAIPLASVAVTNGSKDPNPKGLASGPPASTSPVLPLMGEQILTLEPRRQSMYGTGRGFGMGAILLQQRANAAGEYVSSGPATAHNETASLLRNRSSELRTLNTESGYGGAPDGTRSMDSKHQDGSPSRLHGVQSAVAAAGHGQAGGNGANGAVVPAAVVTPTAFEASSLHKPSPLRRSHGGIAVTSPVLTAAAAFTAGRSSSLRQGDAASTAAAAAAAFTAGRSSSLRHGVCDGLAPVLPPADILRQRQQQNLLLLQQQRESQRVFLCGGAATAMPLSLSSLRGVMPLPSVQVLSHSSASGGSQPLRPQTHNLQTYVPTTQYPQQPQHFQHPGTKSFDSAPGPPNSSVEPELITTLAIAGGGGNSGTPGTSPPHFTGLNLASPPFISTTSAGPVHSSPLNQMSSRRSLTSNSFASGTRMGTAVNGGGGGGGPLFGSSTRRMGLDQGGQLGRPPAGGGILISHGQTRRCEAVAQQDGGGAGGSGPFPSINSAAFIQPPPACGTFNSVSASATIAARASVGDGGSGPTTWPSELQLQTAAAVSQTLATVGFDEVAMMPIALKKRGYSQPLIVYLCRFASSARTFEMQQRLVKMGHGNPTAAAAAVASAAAAAAAAAAEIAGSSCTDKATAGGIKGLLDTGTCVEASLAQLATRDMAVTDSVTARSAGGIALLPVAAATPGGGGGSSTGGGGFLSERLDKTLSSMVGIFRFGNDIAAAVALPPPPPPHLQFSGFLGLVGRRRSSMTGLYPNGTSLPLELSRRSAGFTLQGEMTFAMNVQPALATTPGSVVTPHGRAVSCAGVASSFAAAACGNIRGGIRSSASGGGGFMRRFRRTSLDVTPLSKRRSDRALAASAAPVGMLGTYGIARPMGEVRTMSVKRVQRGPTSGPLITLAAGCGGGGGGGGVMPSAVVSATLPTIHAHHIFSGTSSMPGIGCSFPYDTSQALYGTQHRTVHGATGPLLLGAATAAGGGGGGAIQRPLIRAAGGVGIAAGNANVAAGAAGALSHGGSSDDSPRGAATGMSGTDASAVANGAAGGPFASAGLSSQPLFILGYNSTGGNVGGDGSISAAWEYCGRPGGLVGRAPALMTPTEEGIEVEAEEEEG